MKSVVEPEPEPEPELQESQLFSLADPESDLDPGPT
jgi:hypothetical protein